MSAGVLTPPVGERDHIDGPETAPLTLVEYGDYECPHCGRAYPIIKAVQQELGAELRFVYRNFPLSEAHPHAQHAAEAAESAAVEGKYWEMHDILFEHQDALGDADLVGYAEELGIDADRVRRELEMETHAARVRADFRSGVRSGVNGTPTFFVNGLRYDGSWESPAVFIRGIREAAQRVRDVPLTAAG